jgi:hypothetical protein
MEEEQVIGVKEVRGEEQVVRIIAAEVIGEVETIGIQSGINQVFKMLKPVIHTLATDIVIPTVPGTVLDTTR